MIEIPSKFKNVRKSKNFRSYHSNQVARQLSRTDNATCRLCKGADETKEHILCTCDAISLKRLIYLGKANLTPEEVVSVASRQVLNFFGSLELP